MPDRQRIDAACAVCACPAELVEEWRALQAGRALRWGCWIGVRHDRNGERLKLYVEIPRGAGTLVMIGYEPATGRVEHYHRKKPMAMGDLMSLCDSAPQTLEDLWGMPVETALRFFSPGYSIASGKLAFFLRSGWLGGAAAVRRKLLARESGGSLSCYREMLGTLADEALPDHGVVTVGMNGAVRVGISGAGLVRIASCASRSTSC